MKEFDIAKLKGGIRRGEVSRLASVCFERAATHFPPSMEHRDLRRTL